MEENTRRGDNHQLRKTHCPQGHPYDEGNTYVWITGQRYCRACHRDRTRRSRSRSTSNYHRTDINTERDILPLKRDGYSDRQIARLLHVNPSLIHLSGITEGNN